MDEARAAYSKLLRQDYNYDADAKPAGGWML
jgi:hypothetical protein